MAVSTNNRHPWLGSAQLRTHDVDDATIGALPTVHFDSMLPAVIQDRLHLQAGLIIRKRPLTVGLRGQCGCRVIDGRQTAVGTAHR